MEHFTNLHLKLTTISHDIEYINYIDTVSELAQTNLKKMHNCCWSTNKQCTFR